MFNEISTLILPDKNGDLQVFGVIDEDYRSGEIAVQTFNNHLKEFIDLPSL
ncbi:4616_t:CDS:2, partial [Entrophospora sp. SA101]